MANAGSSAEKQPNRKHNPPDRDWQKAPVVHRKRAAAIQSLFDTATKNHIDPARWLTEVIEKLPFWPNGRINEILSFEGYYFG